jgi:putative ABC transport system substrate-binding protein
VAVIATPGSNPASLAAKTATTTIPIVFGVGEDPVKLGLVASLARPGGNATGINFFGHEVATKRLGLLHELVPKAVRIAVLVNPATAPTTESNVTRDTGSRTHPYFKHNSSTPGPPCVPSIYSLRSYVEVGGLMSYGTDDLDRFRQSGIYTGQILKGAKPADLPVTQSTKFEFVINLVTARSLGLEVPPGLSARADEVIE